ncbi:MAG: hypothetical protein V2I43_16360 [Parvularcula sp.]|jgi:NADPH2 dehydrogenase|nr:hypothetical protein [Parvularcula sp.]
MNATATLKSKRIYLLGVNTGFVREGVPDEKFVEFYRERSSAALHCAILGNVVIPGGVGTNAQSPEISRHPRWTDIAEAITCAGSMPGIQLATTWPGYLGQRKFVLDDPSQAIEAARQLLAKITQDDIVGVLNGFRSAARMAVDHGYRHVQIHAAHGYLPSLLLDRDLNARFGFVQEQMADLADYLRSQKVESSVRWSMRTGDPVFDQRGILESVGNVTSLQFEFIDLSSGHYDIDKRLIYPSTERFLARRHSDSLFVANSLPEQNFIVSGRIATLAAEWPNNVDLGICRDLIANPNFLSSWTLGCRNRGKCHYHSRGYDRLRCPTWEENSKVIRQKRDT